MLIEIGLSITLLLFVSLFVFRTNLQTIRPRNWAMVQSITDAYMTEHQARAEATDFNDLMAETSLWPLYPASNTTTEVVGQLPQGITISGTLVRTRRPAENNLNSAGGTGTMITNPAQIEAWLIESHLTYNVGGRTYVKSRSTVRTR